MYPLHKMLLLLAVCWITRWCLRPVVKYSLAFTEHEDVVTAANMIRSRSLETLLRGTEDEEGND